MWAEGRGGKHRVKLREGRFTKHTPCLRAFAHTRNVLAQNPYGCAPSLWSRFWPNALQRRPSLLPPHGLRQDPLHDCVPLCRLNDKPTLWCARSHLFVSLTKTAAVHLSPHCPVCRLGTAMTQTASGMSREAAERATFILVCASWEAGVPGIPGPLNPQREKRPITMALSHRPSRSRQERAPSGVWLSVCRFSSSWAVAWP